MGNWMWEDVCREILDVIWKDGDVSLPELPIVAVRGAVLVDLQLDEKTEGL